MRIVPDRREQTNDDVRSNRYARRVCRDRLTKLKSVPRHVPFRASINLLRNAGPTFDSVQLVGTALTWYGRIGVVAGMVWRKCIYA
jgi:hypothetical protein